MIKIILLSTMVLVGLTACESQDHEIYMGHTISVKESYIEECAKEKGRYGSDCECEFDVADPILREKVDPNWSILDDSSEKMSEKKKILKMARSQCEKSHLTGKTKLKYHNG